MMAFSLIGLVIVAAVGLVVAGLLFWGIWAILNRGDRDKSSDN